MFERVGERSAIGRRFDVWRATVRAPLLWLWGTIIVGAFAVLVFVRDELLPSDLQEKYKRLNILATIPWYAYAIVALAILFIVTVEGLYRRSQEHKTEIGELEAEHQTALRSARDAGVDTVTMLKAQISALNEFRLNFSHERPIVIWADGFSGEQLDAPGNEVWLVVTDIRLTNCGPNQVPMDFRIGVSSEHDHYRRMLRVGRPSLPPWVTEKIDGLLKDLHPLETPLELGGFGTTKNSYCGVLIPAKVAGELQLTSAEALLRERGLWFQVNDRRVSRSVDYPLNTPARRFEQLRRGVDKGRLLGHINSR